MLTFWWIIFKWLWKLARHLPVIQTLKDSFSLKHTLLIWVKGKGVWLWSSQCCYECISCVFHKSLTEKHFSLSQEIDSDPHKHWAFCNLSLLSLRVQNEPNIVLKVMQFTNMGRQIISFLLTIHATLLFLQSCDLHVPWSQLWTVPCVIVQRNCPRLS